MKIIEDIIMIIFMPFIMLIDLFTGGGGKKNE